MRSLFFCFLRLSISFLKAFLSFSTSPSFSSSHSFSTSTSSSLFFSFSTSPSFSLPFSFFSTSPSTFLFTLGSLTGGGGSTLDLNSTTLQLSFLGFSQVFPTKPPLDDEAICFDN
ncbi:hypothetical protein QL285_029367 [Trifolium repens]|nr:hypothetical protein QL285_029367 [Trifolium repens]